MNVALSELPDFTLPARRRRRASSDPASSSRRRSTTWTARSPMRAARLVARADRRDADPLDARRRRSRRRAATSPACSASISPTSCRDGRDWRQREAECADLHHRDGRVVRAQLPRERPRPFVRSSPLDLERKSRPSRRRYFPRRVGARPAVGGAAGVRLRRLPHAAEKPVFVRLRRASRRRRDGNSRTQRSARNNSRRPA